MKRFILVLAVLLASTGLASACDFVVAQPFMAQQFVATPFVTQTFVAQPFFAPAFVATPFVQSVVVQRQFVKRVRPQVIRQRIVTRIR